MKLLTDSREESEQDEIEITMIVVRKAKKTAFVVTHNCSSQSGRMDVLPALV